MAVVSSRLASSNPVRAGRPPWTAVKLSTNGKPCLVIVLFATLRRASLQQLRLIELMIDSAPH